MNLNNFGDESLAKPFLLKPSAKDYLWGGNRLNQEFTKNIDLEPLAETWECSTHPNGPSIVVSGQYKGLFLSDVLKLHPEYLGSHPQSKNGQIPILIKFIDANKDLSVQVHPTDEYAKEHENGSLGKTEMWYVIDADKDASIIYGFHHDISKEQLRKSLDDGSIEKYMNKVSVKKNDVFLIEAGTVHAIGKGCLIAEIQESSDDLILTSENGTEKIQSGVENAKNLEERFASIKNASEVTAESAENITSIIDHCTLLQLQSYKYY